MRLFQVLFLFLLVSLPIAAVLMDEFVRVGVAPVGSLPPMGP